MTQLPKSLHRRVIDAWEGIVVLRHAHPSKSLRKLVDLNASSVRWYVSDRSTPTLVGCSLSQVVSTEGTVITISRPGGPEEAYVNRGLPSLSKQSVRVRHCSSNN